jgi:hypothetical protein
MKVHFVPHMKHSLHCNGQAAGAVQKTIAVYSESHSVVRAQHTVQIRVLTTGF